MRVLKNNCETAHIEVTCPHCKSELEIEMNDIRYNDIIHRCSEFEVGCGACGRTIGVRSSLIPKSWIATIVPDDFHH